VLGHGWRRPRYRGTPEIRLSKTRPWRRPIAGALVLALAGAAGGCSYQLESLKSSSEVEYTGSVRPATPRQAASLPPENDLVVARAAVSELMTRGGKDTSVPWENPRTGARGTITPIASAYSQDGFTCQDFLASYVRDGSESWMQGEACRQHQGRWEVRNLKPWQRT
jgi:surface antigen